MKRTRRNRGAGFKAQVALAAGKGDKTLTHETVSAAREGVARYMTF